MPAQGVLLNGEFLSVEAIKAIAANYDAQIGDYILECTTGSSGHLTVALPAPSPSIRGMHLLIKKVDSGNKNVIIDANTAGGTIDGANSITITDRYAGVAIYCNGATWYTAYDGRAPKTAGYTGTLDAGSAAVGTFTNGILNSVA